MNKKPVISRLSAGGIITTYRCNSRCSHCLYASGPRREKAYLQGEMLESIISTLRKNGRPAMHIGGGEPFLEPDLLLEIIKRVHAAGIPLEYVETNAGWFSGDDSAMETLRRLRHAGLETLLISISPFHNSFIPFERVAALMDACHATGMRIFPWSEKFLPDLGCFDPTVPHSLEEYATYFGPDYVRDIPRRYWVHMNGRAATTYAPLLPGHCAAEICRRNSGPCRELAQTLHFHIDLDGNYVPGLCSGLAIDHKDLGAPLQEEAYPLLTMLSRTGISALFAYAEREHGYQSDKNFIHKCHLCLDIRHFLVKKCGLISRELQPIGFYDEI